MRRADDTPEVLVVDDEKQIRRLLSISLEATGYRVFQAENGQAGLAAVAERPPDLVLLDLGLPDMGGLEVLKSLREWSMVPVIILSVRDNEDEKATALDSGADDYLTKPFSTGELLARMRVARRRASSPEAVVEESSFRTGPLEVNLAARTASVNGRTAKLTPTEFALMRLFVRHAGNVLTHPQIMEAVWGASCVERINYLHVYITHLREKIEPNPAQPEMLVNEPRVGYRLVRK
jgi:two-component system KDP operon response regulator KdpE